MTIQRSIPIEDLVRDLPEAVSYLARQGIRCIRCGEPIWGTLDEAAKEKGFSDDDINRFIEKLNRMATANK